MSQRQIIKIAVTPEAKQAIEMVSDRYGMSQIEMASRLYNWFADQDEPVQAAVLDLLPRSMAPDIARLALEQLASKRPKAAKHAKNPTGSTAATHRRSARKS